MILLTPERLVAFAKAFSRLDEELQEGVSRLVDYNPEILVKCNRPSPAQVNLIKQLLGGYDTELDEIIEAYIAASIGQGRPQPAPMELHSRPFEVDDPPLQVRQFLALNKKSD